MPGCFYDAGVKGNQVQNLSDPVTVNRELSANYHCTDQVCHPATKEMMIQSGMRRCGTALICEPGNLLK